MNAFFSAYELAAIEHDCVRATIQKVLRAAQTRFTDEQLAEASGVSARCIKSYRVEGREPTLGNALSLLCILGRQDLNRVLALIGYSARPLDESDKRPCNEALALGLHHMSVFATAAADGRIDHIEEPTVRHAADGAIDAMLPYSSAGAAV